MAKKVGAMSKGIIKKIEAKEPKMSPDLSNYNYKLIKKALNITFWRLIIVGINIDGYYYIKNLMKKFHLSFFLQERNFL